MASGTSLRFSVEVAADQAEAALKAMTLAFDQAGVKAKASLQGIGKGARGAKSGLEELKQGMGRARETAMFFTQSIGEFGPAGRTAQIALAGVGGAIMGGGGLLLALSLAQAGVRLLVDYWEEDAKTAAEAAKKHKEAADEMAKYNAQLIGDANTRIGTLNSTREGMRGVTEATKAHNEVLKINQDLQLATSPAIRRTLEMRLAEAKALEQSIAFLERQEGIEKRAEERAKAAQEQWKAYQAERQAITSMAIDQAKAEADAEIKRQEELAKVGAEMNAAAWKRQEEEAARLTELEKKQAADRKASTEAQVAQAQQVGEAVGTMTAGLMTGQMTFAQVAAQVGQMVVASVVKTAIANVTAKAAEAGAGAAASQAEVPIVGPVLAISAMGAMVSAVLSLLGNMPSAAGGWMVPHDTLAMVHEDERILPARYSAGLDRLVNQGGTGTSVALTINAVDAHGVRKLLLSNQPALVEALAKALRDGRRLA